MNLDPPPEHIEAQLQLETQSIELGHQRYHRQGKTRLGNTRDLGDLPIGQLMTRMWVQPLGDALKDSLHKVSRQPVQKQARETLLSLGLTEYEIAFLAVRGLLKMRLDSKTRPTLASVSTCLGRTLCAETQLREFHKQHKRYVEATLENHALTKRKGESIMNALMRGKERVMGETEVDQELSNVDAYRVGSEVIRVLLVVCSDWFVLTKGTSKHKPAILDLTPMAMEWIQSRTDIAEGLRPVYQPMIIPPLDWQEDGTGGYLTLKAPLTRKGSNPSCTHDTLPSPEARRALNVAQRTPWRINTKVLDVAQRLNDQRSGIAGLPTYVDVPTDDGRDLSDPEAKRVHRKSQLLATQQNIKADTGVTLVRMQLDIADDFRNCEAIYFPHNFDWRGRIYPIPSLLTPQSDDLGRALLEFSEGKPLGLEGYRWLAIHTANTYGEDKLSFEDRVEWVEANEDHIIRSAKDPLGYLWWSEADSPWKFLACCFEWQAMIEFDGALGDFISHLPVALDGTCSGLQHFSALLRDSRGGASVNLVPSSKPSDIYSEVAQEVLKIIDSDDALKNSWQARVWDGLIARDTCKRGTMTQPYSVTVRGMTAQLDDLIRSKTKYDPIWDRIRFEQARARDTMTDDQWTAYQDKPSWGRACNWLGGILGQAINEVVIASEQGRKFICAIAQAYSSADMFWSWDTPLGMRITQGYRKPDTIRINTFFGKVRVRVNLVDDQQEMPKSKRKTRSGASPNFIHSLDATHLMMTVLECYDLGRIKSFALVHDSFGVHAGVASTLTVALRHTFATLYQGDLLADLLDRAFEELPEEYHADLPELPQKGTLDLDMVLASPYLFC